MDETSEDFRNTYRMLGRLRSDCEYFLNYGRGHVKDLWAGDVAGQIAEMRRLWNGLPEDAKPEWLSADEIDAYEERMLALTAGEAAPKEAGKGLPVTEETAKGLAGWNLSGKPLDEYLKVGDAVADDLVDYMMDVVPPASLGEGGFKQVGEPYDHAELPGTGLMMPLYETFVGIEGENVYAGACAWRTAWPNAEALAEARPELAASLAAKRETTCRHLYESASSEWRYRNIDGNVWRVRVDYAPCVDGGEPRVAKAYLPDKSDSLSTAVVSIGRAPEGGYAVDVLGGGPRAAGATFEEAYGRAMREVASHPGPADRFRASGYDYPSMCDREAAFDTASVAHAAELPSGVREVMSDKGAQLLKPHEFYHLREAVAACERAGTCAPTSSMTLKGWTERAEAARRPRKPSSPKADGARAARSAAARTASQALPSRQKIER